MRQIALLAVFVLLASPLFATEFAVTPNSGPVSGGTEVTITGDFGNWPYDVYFGMVRAASSHKVDEHTMVAVTPAHLPGPSQVRVFEYDMFLPVDAPFTFTGDASDAFDRFLLPIFVPPVQGAFGSEFHTDLRMVLTKGPRAEVFGVSEPWYSDQDPAEFPLVLIEAGPESGEVLKNGTPGRFIYVAKSDAGGVAMNLRAYDVSRDTENFGTELPIVRESDFASGDDAITLLDVPMKPGFRNTLRIYSPLEGPVRITVEGPGVILTWDVMLGGAATIFDPAYAVFTGFPQDLGLRRVRISRTPPITLPAAPFWAFVSVTNNDTQLITTITPQP